MMFDTLALISTLIAIALLHRFINIFPSLMACTIRWKENINIHNSLKLRTDRNLLSLAMILPFCLCIYHFQIYKPGFLDTMTETLKLTSVIGVFVIYTILRSILYFSLKPPKGHDETFMAAHYAARTFFILLTLTIIAVAGCLSLFNVPVETTQSVIFWLTGGIYLIFILRKIQILLSGYSFFMSFLYLCALEILPTGVLVSSVVIF